MFEGLDLKKQIDSSLCSDSAHAPLSRFIWFECLNFSTLFTAQVKLIDGYPIEELLQYDIDYLSETKDTGKKKMRVHCERLRTLTYFHTGRDLYIYNIQEAPATEKTLVNGA